MRTTEVSFATFKDFLAGLQQSLRDLFIERSQAHGQPKKLLQRRLLLGLELLWKLEEQLFLPALQDEGPSAADRTSLLAAEHELKLMRDLAALAVAQPGPQERDITLSMLEGLASLHFERVDSLITDSAAAPDWQSLHNHALALLDRWYGEVAAVGDIEDEDGDPVGRPPR